MKVSKRTLIIIVVLVLANIAAYFYTSTKMSSEGSSKQVDLSVCKLEELDETRIALTIPSDYIGGASQSDLDAVAKEANYESITLNPDGSGTYIMTKEQHQQMLADLATGINEKIHNLAGTKPYDDITEIVHDDDFTSFQIYTSNKNADYDSSMIVLNLKMFSTMYYAFDGAKSQQLHFDFYNVNGDLIATLDSDIAD